MVVEQMVEGVEEQREVGAVAVRPAEAAVVQTSKEERVVRVGVAVVRQDRLLPLQIHKLIIYLHFFFPAPMSPLNWQEVPSKGSSPKARPDTVPQRSQGVLGFIVGIMSGAAFSMALMGLIIGYTVGKWMNPNSFALGGSAPQQVAQVPAAPIAPTAAAQAPTPPSSPVPPVDPKTDHIRGDLSKATVAFIEYSDFECPFCKRFFPTTQQITQTYGDKVAFVYRHFPLSFHQNAHKEAEASECVNELGGSTAFWKFHDYVFDKTTSNGTGFPLDQLPVAAKASGVDTAKFQTCLDSGKYVKLVDDEETSGGAAGVTGTPGNFVVNLKTQKSQLVEGAVPFESIKTAIDSALNG